MITRLIILWTLCLSFTGLFIFMFIQNLDVYHASGIEEMKSYIFIGGIIASIVVGISQTFVNLTLEHKIKRRSKTRKSL